MIHNYLILNQGSCLISTVFQQNLKREQQLSETYARSHYHSSAVNTASTVIALRIPNG